MAFSVRNIYAHKSCMGLRLLENNILYLSYSHNSLRHLRGSRLGKGFSKEEAKYRNLLKTIRDESIKPIIYTSGNIPVGEITKASEESANVSEQIEMSVEALCRKLEEKITPLKGMPYNRQLEKKYKKSLALLRLFGQKLIALKIPLGLGKDNLPCPVDLTIPSPLVESYRNQDEFSICPGLDGTTKTVGFYAGQQNSFCLSPSELTIIKESHKELAKDFQNFLKESPLAANIHSNDGGYWHSLKIKSNCNDELMGIINLNPQEMTKQEFSLEGDKLREYFLEQKPYYLKSLYLQECTQVRNERSLNLLFGESCIQENFSSMKLQISPDSFFPSNTKALEYAYANLMKVTKVKKNTTVLDIFCGTGPLSLMMSPYVQRCIGVDSCSSSIKDAQQNAIANNRQNVEFLEGNIEYLISDVLNKDYHEDIIAVVNLSRGELSKTAIKCLRACKFMKKIVFITTKPKTAMDNFIRLCRPCGSELYLGKFFCPILAIPVDLSPQTDHFALMVMFQRL